MKTAIELGPAAGATCKADAPILGACRWLLVGLLVCSLPVAVVFGGAPLQAELQLLKGGVPSPPSKGDGVAAKRAVFTRLWRLRSRFAKPSVEQTDPLPSYPIPQRGPYNVQNGTFRVGHLVSDNGTVQEAAIYWPVHEGNSKLAVPSYHFVSFGHGMGSGLPRFFYQYDSLLATLASYGLVVVSPLSCPFALCHEYANGTALPTDFSRDLMSVIKTCSADKTLHPALRLANFSSVGVMGHSMGATAAGTAAADADASLRIGAYVGLHGPPLLPRDNASSHRIRIPMLLTAGGQDEIVYPYFVRQAYNDATHAVPRAYAKLSNATHYEPVTPSCGPCPGPNGSALTPYPGGYLRENPYVAQFLLCHLAGSNEACGLVYDSGNPKSLCQAYGDEQECKITHQ